MIYIFKLTLAIPKKTSELRRKFLGNKMILLRYYQNDWEYGMKTEPYGHNSLRFDLILGQNGVQNQYFRNNTLNFKHHRLNMVLTAVNIV